MSTWKHLIFLSVVILACAVLMGQSGKQSGLKGLKVGVVELEEAVRKSKRGKELLNSLEAEVKNTESELDAEKAEIEQLKKEYEAKSNMWDEMTRRQKRSEIDLKEKSLSRKARDYQNYYLKKQTEAVKPLIEDFEDLIEKMGQEQNFDIIFEISGAVMYINEDKKITQEVVRYADSVFK
jgi:outer membrane protein